jgi:hypothetical protein
MVPSWVSACPRSVAVSVPRTFGTEDVPGLGMLGIDNEKHGFSCQSDGG